MVIQAKFIGTNSLGYEHGTEYQLILSNNSGTSIRKMDGTGLCVYTSLSAFLKNWDNINSL